MDKRRAKNESWRSGKTKVKVGQQLPKKKSDLGIIVKIEKDFYRHNDYFQDRLTIWWFHGETTAQPTAYVEMINRA